LHIFNLFCIFLILFFQLSKQVIGFFLQILNHKLFLFLSVNYKIIFTICFEGIGYKIVVICHCLEFKVNLFNIFLQQESHILYFLLSSRFFLQNS